jgi:hypothetical protein
LTTAFVDMGFLPRSDPAARTLGTTGGDVVG